MADNPLVVAVARILSPHAWQENFYEPAAQQAVQQTAIQFARLAIAAVLDGIAEPTEALRATLNLHEREATWRKLLEAKRLEILG